MTPTEFLISRNIVAKGKSDLIIGFDNDSSESLIELLKSYNDANLKIELKTIKVCELPRIKVVAKEGKNIIDTGNECIELAKLLETMVELYWNDVIINIFQNTDIDEITKKIVS